MKKTIKFLIITIVVILILSGSAFAYLYFSTDLFKSNDEMFIKYSNVMIEDINKILMDNNIINYEIKKQNSKYENNGSIEVALQLQDDEENESVDSTVIDFNGKVDNLNSMFQENINLNYAEDVKLPISVVKNNDKYAITSSDIMKAYAAIENTNLKEFFQKLGIDDSNIPDKLEINTKEINLYENNELVLKQEYKDIISNNISADFFSKEDSTEGAYVLSIPAVKIKNIAIEFINKMKNDETILEDIRKMYTDEEEYKNVMDTIIENINNINENDLNGKYLTIKVYETKNGVTTAIISYEELNCKISTSKENINITINNKEEEVASVVLTKTNTESLIKYELNISTSLQESINMKLIEKAREQANNYDNIDETNNENIRKDLINISYEIENIGTDNPNEKVTIIYNNIGEENKIALGLEYKNDIEFNEDMEIVELNEENSVILNDLSRDTLTTTVSQILLKLQELNETKIVQAKQKQEKSIIIFMLEKISDI